MLVKKKDGTLRMCIDYRVRTDHNSLRFFLEQKQLQERQQKWISKIQAYALTLSMLKVRTTWYQMPFHVDQPRYLL